MALSFDGDRMSSSGTLEGMDDRRDRTESSRSREERQNLLYARDRLSNNTLYSCISSSSNQVAPKYFSSFRYWKNLIVVSLAFMFTFSAYSALSNLQSCLDYSSGLGVASLCAIYIGIIVSGLFSPLMIWVLKPKWTMVVCSGFYALYSASNIYPAVYTLIPAAALLGVAASPFWTAVATYLTTSAIQLAEVKDEIPQTTINRFNGIFFCLFKSAQLWGNLISSLVLHDTSAILDMSKCGRYSCGTSVNFTNITGEVHLVDKRELILIFIYIALGLIATLIFIFLLDNLPKASHKENRSWRTHISKHLWTTFRLMKSPYLFLLIPLILYTGAEEAFICADFTKSFVSCTRGPGEVGYVMIGFGVAGAVSSVIFGQIEKYTGRMAIFMFGGVVHMALLISFQVWNPEHSATWQLVLMAVGWSIGDAVLLTQILSLLGVLFPESQEPAFANFQLWQAVGFAVSYALTIPTPICVFHKLYGLMGCLAFSLIFYIADEYLIFDLHRGGLFNRNPGSVRQLRDITAY